jgi:uncharacterized protein (DUF305 family)
MQFTRRAVTAAIVATFVLIPVGSLRGTVAQEATPPATYRCENVAAASPIAGMEGMAMGTPAAGPDAGMAGQSVEFDQLYIDMMLPHHESIIALAQAAHDRLTDERLVAIADNIISSQQAENEELRGLREQWYDSAEPMPLDEAMMGMMAEQMPGMGDMDAMMTQMNPETLVAMFCAGENPDLTVIDLTIPHHEMAIRASEAALKRATHEEIRTIAERVIADQQREIDELEAIRAELTGQGTPADA